jgi:hypothetical protein
VCVCVWFGLGVVLAIKVVSGIMLFERAELVYPPPLRGFTSPSEPCSTKEPCSIKSSDLEYRGFGCVVVCVGRGAEGWRSVGFVVVKSGGV